MFHNNLFPGREGNDFVRKSFCPIDFSPLHCIFTCSLTPFPMVRLVRQEETTFLLQSHYLCPGVAVTPIKSTGWNLPFLPGAGCHSQGRECAGGSWGGPSSDLRRYPWASWKPQGCPKLAHTVGLWFSPCVWWCNPILWWHQNLLPPLFYAPWSCSGIKLCTWVCTVYLSLRKNVFF